MGEDNETNQYAASTILRQLGCDVELAPNGRVAVETCVDHAFDLILMDMQMPEMDGITATRLIRAQPGPNQRVPILALTANAFVEDAEACRAAGMNEHLTKPLRKAALSEALSRFLGTKKAAPAAAPAAAPVLSPDAWQALMEDFGEEGLRRLGKMFVAEQGAELESMSPDDRASLRRKAHSLKGASRLFGASNLANAAEKLEAAAMDAGANEVAAMTAAIMLEFAHVCREIETRLAA